ncbi:balbiani ring protein 3-like [Biomphalaria glabrata]|uniref:Metalloendopeptidase n=1 Tax=Biomphalaria glabrata TaxID=6526 RepID=A0A9W2Z053_BIOGL|nr:balbiani ring protein 3-like [Biomphalaria glabrata]
MRSNSIFSILMLFSIHGQHRTESLEDRNNADTLNVRQIFNLESSRQPNENQEEDIKGTGSNEAKAFLYQRFLGQARKLTKRKATRHERFRWTQATIPYEFVPGDFNSTEIDRIRAAMYAWSSKTCLTFRAARSSDVNKIKFKNGYGCNSMVGMVGGTQIISLAAAGCRNDGMYLHELGHAIGLVHEHQLPERDEYIHINVDNVQPHMQDWYEKYSSEDVNNYGVPYEYSSVMHYGLNDFARDQHKQTIFVQDRTREHEVGEVWRKGLSFTDIKVVNLMYKCNKNCAPNQRCKEPGYLDRWCRCVCPPEVDCTKEGHGLRVGGGWGIGSDCRNSWKDEDCIAWAKRGECQGNPIWMKTNCRKACEKCAKNCSNVWPDEDCSKWAARGECSKNKQWMVKHCKESCGGCGTGFNLTSLTNWTLVEILNGTDDETNVTSGLDLLDDNASNSTDLDRSPSTLVTSHTITDITSTSTAGCSNIWPDRDCKRWAEKGECILNKKWMEKNCSRSCHICHTECSNIWLESDCTKWAARGECNLNKNWMEKNCKESCKVCQRDCTNVYSNTDCDKWAISGECSANKNWMETNCRQSCEVCLSDCQNIWPDTDCKKWADKGECSANSKWMGKYCRRSCDACNKNCSNKWSDTECYDWADRGECERNEHWMKENCFKSCGECAAGCTNVWPDFNCNKWADRGECTHNKEWMDRNCKESCGTCKTGCVNIWPDKDCDKWTENGECKANAKWMKKNCKQSCRFCKLVNGTVNERKSWYNNDTLDSIDVYDESNLFAVDNITDLGNDNIKEYSGEEEDFVNEDSSGLSNLSTLMINLTTVSPTPITRKMKKCGNIWSDEDCSKWALRGECSLNKKWMEKNCKESCQKCSQNCTNIWPNKDCDKWASRGECEINTKWMERNCIRSCDACNQDCSNVWPDTDCIRWADRGECSTNQLWMETNCMRSCAACNMDCFNIWPDADCKKWSEQNECSKNQKWMQTNCRLSCDACNLNCSNRWNSSQCTQWADQGECSSNKNWMEQNCKEACKVCQSNLGLNETITYGLMNTSVDNEDNNTLLNQESLEFSGDHEADIGQENDVGQNHITITGLLSHPKSLGSQIKQLSASSLLKNVAKVYGVVLPAVEGVGSTKMVDELTVVASSTSKTFRNTRTKTQQGYLSTLLATLSSTSSVSSATQTLSPASISSASSTTGAATSHRTTSPAQSTTSPPALSSIRSTSVRAFSQFSVKSTPLLKQTSASSTKVPCFNRWHNRDCELWAQRGHCRINPSWMLKHCSKSCFSC